MHRREFLGLLLAMAAAGVAAPTALRARLAQTIRTRWWPPQSFTLQLPVVLEWRYLAGRITEGADDYGFVVSVASYNEIRNPLRPGEIIQAARYELLVTRQALRGDPGHTSRVYSQPGTSPNFSPNTNTYRFNLQDAALTWTLAEDDTYRLNVSSPELSLGELVLRPISPLVAEGGDGELPIAQFGPAIVKSDYYNDWVRIERAGQVIGYGRLDLQTLRPTNIAQPTGFSHHWFAVAAKLADDSEVWLSAYELVSEQTYWYATLGRRAADGTWSVEALSHENLANVAHPLRVEILEWQPQLRQDGTPVEPAQRTGKRWRVRLGRAAPGDLLDLDLPVLPGQFLQGARISGVITSEAMQEAVGTTLSGSVGGVAVTQVYFTLAESTYSEPTPTIYLPLVQR